MTSLPRVPSLVLVLATFLLPWRADGQAPAPGSTDATPPGVVVVKDALEVVRRPSSLEPDGAYVSYKVRAPYPAEGVIGEIRTRLEETGWKPLARESIVEMNPSSLRVGWRSHVIDRSRRDPSAKGESYVWNAQWSNAAGDLVAYTLMYESGPPKPGKEGSGPDNDDLRVSASLSKNKLMRTEDLAAPLIVLDGARDVMATRQPAVDQVVFGGDGSISTSRDPARAAYKTKLIYTLAASRPPSAAMASLDERLGKLGWVETAEEAPPYFPAEKWAESHKSGWNETKSTLPTGLLEWKWRAQWRNPAGDTLIYALTRREAAPAGEAPPVTGLIDYHVEASLRPATGKPQAAVSPTPTKTPRSAAEIESRVEPAYRRGDYDTLLDLLREADSGGGSLLERYRQAASDGSPLAQGIVGVMYESGIGVSKNESEAVGWFRKAADQGDPTGQKYLADMYRQGKGVSPDSAQAMSWYLRASDQDDGPAQAMIAVMYQRGLGVLPNQERAYMWLTAAISNLQGSDWKAMMEARRRQAAAMTAESVASAEKLAQQPRPTAATWRPDPGDLAWRAVDVDDAIWLVDTMFGKGPKGSLNLGGEEVSEKNAKQVTERLRREKREIAASLESTGARDVRGSYGLSIAPEDQCNVAKSPRAEKLRKTVRIVPKKIEIELEGEALQGCGFIGGDVIVLKNQCGGTSPYRFIGMVADAGIEITTWDKASGRSCRLGTLTKGSAPQ